MNPDRKDFLSLRRFPARLNSEEAAWLLGFAAHDIPILIQAGLLKPLGHPPPNGVKYFATEMLTKHSADTNWMSRATDAVIKHWKNKNTPKATLHADATI